ncbi:hypothetical protein [Roseateles violae]|uniref:Uncharacterized protein n=1 Tax=Roseateles violae TaxID=3058042 RepID=A0ABT8DY49_9BURK|nr:hypothetical protein [Pelomonas sp. PFR6]MDN3922142.1 hypothetical protein [Pelomonas sp. PFR6]
MRTEMGPAKTALVNMMLRIERTRQMLRQRRTRGDGRELAEAALSPGGLIDPTFEDTTWSIRMNSASDPQTLQQG